jgi:hypothetical protein
LRHLHIFLMCREILLQVCSCIIFEFFNWFTKLIFGKFLTFSQNFLKKGECMGNFFSKHRKGFCFSSIHYVKLQVQGDWLTLDMFVRVAFDNEFHILRPLLRRFLNDDLIVLDVKSCKIKIIGLKRDSSNQYQQSFGRFNGL